MLPKKSIWWQDALDLILQRLTKSGIVKKPTSLEDYPKRALMCLLILIKLMMPVQILNIYVIYTLLKVQQQLFLRFVQFCTMLSTYLAFK